MSKKVDIKRGSAVVAVGEGLEYHGEWMQHGYVTVTVKSAVKVDFAVGDYVEHCGRQYYLWNAESVKKQARSGSYGEAFVYEKMKLYEATVAMEQVSMHDYVLGVGGGNGEAYTSLGRFSFYGASVEDLADRIQANLLRQAPAIGSTTLAFRIFTPDYDRCFQRFGATQNEWEAYYTGNETGGNTDVVVNIQDETTWGALGRVYNDFALPYYVNGLDIVVGGKSESAGGAFAYGKGNGLHSIERNADQEQRIMTRLFAYGSSENLPLNYYGNMHKLPYADGLSVNTFVLESVTFYYVDTLIPMSSVSAAIGWEMETVPYDTQTQHFHTDLPVSVTLSTDSADTPSYASFCIYELNGEQYLSLSVTHDISSAITSESKLYLHSGVDINRWPSSKIQDVTDYPAGMAIQNLMLPGFPTMSLYNYAMGDGEGTYMASLPQSESVRAAWRERRQHYTFSTDKASPWIQSAKASVYGIREGEAYFDGSDHDEVKPTIANTEYCYIIGEGGIADNGWVGEGGTFTIEVRDTGRHFWEEVWKTRVSDDMEMAITSGYHNGRSFKATKLTMSTTTGNAVFTCNRIQDESGRWIPNTEQPISNGNTFAAIGIQLPKEYVDAASKKLFELALDELDRIDHGAYTYLPHIDEIYMAKEQAEAIADERVPLHDKIRPGMVMSWTDADLGDVSSIIDSLTIKEDGNNGIPTYDVVLRDEKEKTLAQTIGAEIKKSSSGGSGRGENPTAPSAASIIEAASGAFLSKTEDDTAQGLIGFVKGLWVKTLGLFGFDQHGNATAKSLTVKDDTSNPASTVASIDGDGDATLHDVTASGDLVVTGDAEVGGDLDVTGTTNGTDAIFENLTVTKAAHFFKLIIDEVKATQGQVIITAANAKLDKVEAVTGGWKCYFRSSDADGNEISNTFAANDLVLCQTFNAATGVSYNASNKYYWRKCTSVSSSPESVYINEGDEEQVACHWIVLSSSDCDKPSQSGDTRPSPDVDYPEAGDNVVMLGNSDNNSGRQAAIIISAYNNTYLDPAIKAPSIVQYDGINNYNLVPFRKNIISKNLNSFTGTFYVSGNTTVTDLIEEIELTPGPQGEKGDKGEKGAKGDNGNDGSTIRSVQVFKLCANQPVTPTGSDVPPTGWSLSPVEQTDFYDGTGVHEGWREASGNQQDYVFKKERYWFTTNEDNQVLTIELMASSENTYDFIQVGALDTSVDYSPARDIERSATGTSGTVTTVNITVSTAGTHFVDIVYTKDETEYGGEDKAWYRAILGGVVMNTQYEWTSFATIVDGELSGTWSTPYRWSPIDGTNGANGKDAHDANPNILLRTVFENGMDAVKESWTAPETGGWSDISIPASPMIDGRKCAEIDASEGGSYVDLRQNVVARLQPNTWYTLSFYCYADGLFYTYIYSGDSNYPVIDQNAGVYVDGVFNSSIGTDGAHQWSAEADGARHTFTFKTASSFTTNRAEIIFRALTGVTLDVCMPKLETGKDATPYMPNEQDLQGKNGQSGQTGADAEFYKLVPLNEAAVVTINGTLGVVAQYNIAHIVGSTSELITPSASGYHIQIIPNVSTGVSISYTYDSILKIVEYKNTQYMTNWHTAAANARPSYFTVKLVDGNNTPVSGEERQIAVTFAVDASFSINSKTGEIELKAQGNADNIAKIEMTVGQQSIINMEYVTIDYSYSDSHEAKSTAWEKGYWNNAGNYVSADNCICSAQNPYYIGGTNGFVVNGYHAAFAILEIDNTGVTPKQYVLRYTVPQNYTVKAYIMSYVYKNNSWARDKRVSEVNGNGGMVIITPTTGKIRFKVFFEATGKDIGANATAISEALSELQPHFGSITLSNSLIQQTGAQIRFRVEECGIDITNKKILAKTDNFEIQNISGQKTFGIDEDGNLETLGDASIGGTVRAKNFFNNIVMFNESSSYEMAGQYSYGRYYCFDVPDGYSFVDGGYYTYEEIEETGFFNDPEVEPSEYFMFCTYDANVINMLPLASSGGSWNSVSKTVLLPDPKDFYGKMVEVYSFYYGSVTPGYPIVGCVASTKFIDKVYYENGKVRKEGAAYGTKSIVAGEVAKFISVAVIETSSSVDTTKYYWLKLA